MKNVSKLPASAQNLDRPGHCRLSSVAVHAGSTLAITNPAKAKGIVYVPTAAAAWSKHNRGSQYAATLEQYGKNTLNR
ncbi:hypothetical protein [Paenibacillus sp. S150]|uniref:hypothetical protein n=1 Tax=Paenibacillus sp. S150 TaxID=2749826 RepID=UPI001C57EACC|nr:hypothetical protein [Paenibacillus sp. S150]MBW4081169.1 hypothetical protein [Paenibacillus sp. S150]